MLILLIRRLGFVAANYETIKFDKNESSTNYLFKKL